MGNAMTVLCRSYSARAFDGWPACVDAALEAVSQAAAYVLGRTDPGLAGPAPGPLEMSNRIRITIHDEQGVQLGADELEVEQAIESVLPADDFAVAPDATDPEGEHDLEDDGHDPAAMGLEDFQTVLDRVEVGSAGSRGLCGLIAGDLYGFERLIGTFQALVEPGY